MKPEVLCPFQIYFYLPEFTILALHKFIWLTRLRTSPFTCQCKLAAYCIPPNVLSSLVLKVPSNEVPSSSPEKMFHSSASLTDIKISLVLGKNFKSLRDKEEQAFSSITTSYAYVYHNTLFLSLPGIYTF